jgi:tetratricopeptide (TPR) repeat protein
MSTGQTSIYIAYRRHVSAFIARAIYADLTQHGYDAFIDVERVDAGTFDTVSQHQIAAHAHFLLILAPGTVERCLEPQDWLRQEIENAIRFERNIIPVLVNGFTFEAYRKYLVGALRDLPRYNGLTLYHEYFEEGMARLRERFLVDDPAGTLLNISPEEREVIRRTLEKSDQQPPPTTQQLTAETLFMRGLEAFHQERYPAAVSAFDRCLRAFPKFAPAYVMRASARGRLGDIQGAISDLVQYLAMDDEHNYVSRTGVARMINSLRQRHQSTPMPNRPPAALAR